ncbi:MAG: hypothetical protein KBA72_02140 [Thermoanaerobaculia bacterium]|jgi:hypothetical protein|nr:hypothetical protein [Thermoanaerobaculia bacterium]
MDPKRLKDVHDRLESLDDRLSYRLRARSAGPGRASLEQIEDRLRDVTEYALELRTLVMDLLLGLVGKPDAEPPAR